MGSSEESSYFGEQLREHCECRNDSQMLCQAGRLQDDETMEIISNTAIIAVNQDRLGQPATRIWKKPQEAGGDLQLWAGSLADGLVLLPHHHIGTLSHGYSICFIREDQP